MVAGRGTVEVRVGMCVSSSRNIDVGIDPGSSSVLNRCRSHRSCSRVHAFPCGSRSPAAAWSISSVVPAAGMSATG